MTHPLLLHMRASLWSLNAALGALTERAGVEAEEIAAEQALDGSDGLRSTVYGQRGGSGGHGDPVAGVALAGVDREPRPNRYAQLAASVTDTLRWLADTVRAPEGAADPLSRLDAAQLLPATAATVTKWLDENDRRIRDCLNLPPQLWALPGVDCPRCRLRSLYVQTAAPSHLWTVICRAGCVCSGEGCPCLMPVRLEGVGHIWDRHAPLVELALAGGVAPYDNTHRGDMPASEAYMAGILNVATTPGEGVA